MIIDFHTHALPPGLKQDRARGIALDPAFAAIYGSEKAGIATAEDILGVMDRDGVSYSVIMNYGWSSAELIRETNDYIAESVARYPDRLGGFIALPLTSPREALAEIERCARPGIYGIGELRIDLPPADALDMGTIRPVFEALIARKLMLMLHASEPVGHAYPGKGTATPQRIYPLLAAFPELTVICAHWGGGLPFYALMPEVGKVLQNVYFDTAASPFLYQPRIYTEMCRLVGPEKILFGTDFPLIPPSRYLREIEVLELPEADKKAILGGNASRLLGITPG